jgi:hypothetical protein
MHCCEIFMSPKTGSSTCLCNVTDAAEFRLMFRDGETVPGTVYQGPMCAVTFDSGIWESWGFAGDLARLRTWAVTVIDITGTPTLVILVDLEAGDYIGSVSGRLLINRGNVKPHCLRGPHNLVLPPSPGPLSMLFVDPRPTVANIAIAWHLMSGNGPYWKISHYEFHAFVTEPILALEALAVHRECLVG